MPLRMTSPHCRDPPEKLKELFRVRRRKPSDPRIAVCELWTHTRGRELRLLVDGQLSRFLVSGNATVWEDAAGVWLADLLELGWEGVPDVDRE